MLVKKGVQTIQIPMGVRPVFYLYWDGLVVNRYHHVDFSIMPVSPIECIRLRARVKTVDESLRVIVDNPFRKTAEYGRISKCPTVKSTEERVL